jgi:hypothetical protein
MTEQLECIDSQDHSEILRRFTMRLDLLEWKSKIDTLNLEYRANRHPQSEDDSPYVGMICGRIDGRFVCESAPWCSRELSGRLDSQIRRVRNWVPTKFTMHSRPSMEEVCSTVIIHTNHKELVDVAVLPENYVYSISDLKKFVKQVDGIRKIKCRRK